MGKTTFDQQVEKHAEKLATAIKRKIEKDNNDAWRAAEKKRLADKEEARRIKTRDAKLAHIFFRVMRKGMGDAWVLKCLEHIKATTGVMQDFACLLPQASPKAAVNAKTTD